MSRELNFSVTRNNLGYVLICWWVILFLRGKYWGQVVEMNFCSISVKLVILLTTYLMKIFSFPGSWVICNKIYCPCITILEYTSQSRKFGKFINIRLNKKTLRRSSITYFKKQPPEVFYKKAVLKNLAMFTTRKQLWCSLFLSKLHTLRPVALLKRGSNTGVFLWILQNLQEHLFWR